MGKKKDQDDDDRAIDRYVTEEQAEELDKQNEAEWKKLNEGK